MRVSQALAVEEDLEAGDTGTREQPAINRQPPSDQGDRDAIRHRRAVHLEAEFVGLFGVECGTVRGLRKRGCRGSAGILRACSTSPSQTFDGNALLMSEPARTNHSRPDALSGAIRFTKLQRQTETGQAGTRISRKDRCDVLTV